MPPTGEGLCDLPASRMRALLLRREVSARELVEAHLRRVEAVNGAVNAIVTLTAELAMERAAAADESLARGVVTGPLHGIPVAHKDLQETRGVRTTYGSVIHADFVPHFDSLVVERMTAAGAISLGKTNVPEFGTGSQTYNAVFGATRNPYDLSKTAGGSSGGSAAALATGMVALADGSDMGGSLRNPAGFCNVVGLRPGAGRVPSWPTPLAWFDLAVDGPMARTVTDAALLLSVLAGHDARCPNSLPGDGSEFDVPLDADLCGLRVAWSRDLGGLPMDPQVTDVLDRAGISALERIGCHVDAVEPDFTGADDAFRTWRAWDYATTLRETLDRHREVLNPDVVANIEAGRRLTGDDLGRAERARTALRSRMVELLQRYDVLALPVSQVPPFDVDLPWVREIDGERMHTYLDWMRSAYWISVTGLPAISVPCGFTPEGLPVGLQLVGRACDELGLLRIAHGIERATGAFRQAPDLTDLMRRAI
ncbi:amidase [Streptomyces atratus]|uniref:amidase n=1 Tax=Streptomyces atratus TaxID=1893 RepID=UPI00225251EC|nr:amidase [Streptomyces atratus]MCX5339227.1 amidase [Streptomyces atratus]